MTHDTTPPVRTTPKRLLVISGFAAAFGLGASYIGAALTAESEAGWANAVMASAAEQEERRAEQREGRQSDAARSVIEGFALEPLLIEQNQIKVLLRRDSIPSLTDPALESIERASTWLEPGDRVVVVGQGAEAVASPIRLLNWHEIFNMTVGGEPLAVTYCPLCDSASVFSRRVEHDGEEVVLEFGTSGALYNSNVLMYDRTTEGLWSQVGLKCVSGPLAGTMLEHRPLRMMTFGEFRLRHAGGKVVSRETGHGRDYDANPYETYFSDPDRLLVEVPGQGDALPRKTLGLGVFAAGDAWFVTTDALGDGFTLETPLGAVRARAGEAGVEVLEAPAGSQTVQTFYYAWSAFHPQTEVIGDEG